MTRSRNLPLFAALLCAFLTLGMLGQSGCKSAPSARVVAYQTLKAVGQTAESSVALTAQLYQSGQLTAAQTRQVMDFYNTRFQPAYRVAVAAAGADLSSVASPDLQGLASQLASLVQSFLVKPPAPTSG